MTFSTAFQSNAFQNDAFQIASDTPTQRFTGSGGWNKDWAKRYGPEAYWKVKTRKGKVRKFKSGEDALAAAARLSTPEVEYAGVDLGAEFSRLLKTYKSADLDRRITEQIAAQLAAIEMHALRQAAERDDEEALLLLLH